jgi:hypothetical protein
MSHLSILPTVLRDLAALASSLEGLGLRPERGGVVPGFAAEAQPVALRVQLEGGHTIGWQHQPDGRLALVADLQRLSTALPLQRLLRDLTRSYAARTALDQLTAEPALAGAEVVLCP